MTQDPDSKAPPFPKHRIYYVVLKWVVILVAVIVALKVLTGFVP